MAQRLVTLLLCAVAVSYVSAQLGAMGNVKTPTSQDDEDVVKIKSVQSSLEQQLGKKFQEFTVVSYASQVVAGTNYFAKVRISATEYVHVRVFAPLPHTKQQPELHGYQTGKLLGDDITYFDKQEITTTANTVGAAGSKDKASGASYFKFDLSIFALFFVTIIGLFAF